MSEFFMPLILGIGITLMIVPQFLQHIWQQESVERGYAQYCPNNGKWAWKGECK